jgi:hypothetical protein
VERFKNRRGVTLVLMAFMLTVLIGSAAFAVDFGRMFLYRSQLHTAADAAALAGVVQIAKKDPASAQDSAVAFADKHNVGAIAVSLSPADVVPGHWTLAGGFTTTTWVDPLVNAVQVTTRYTGIYGFGKILGLTSHDVSATSQAVFAYAGKTTCVRPVAIPYQSLLNQIYGVDASGNPIEPVTHDLTDSDIASLQAAGPAAAVPLKLGDNATQGNFYIVQLGPYAHDDQIPLSPSPTFGGNNIFADRFGGDCSNSPWAMGPGDWLQGKTGDANGPTEAGYQELCGITINNPGTYGCPAPLLTRSIKVAMWATEDDGVCSPRCFHVKYVGVFVVTQYTKSSGTSNDGITGYFSTLATTGSFSDSPSPIQRIGLIK